MLERTPCKVRNANVEIFHFKKNIILDGRLQSSTSQTFFLTPRIRQVRKLVNQTVNLCCSEARRGVVDKGQSEVPALYLRADETLLETVSISQAKYTQSVQQLIGYVRNNCQAGDEANKFPKHGR